MVANRVYSCGAHAKEARRPFRFPLSFFLLVMRTAYLRLCPPDSHRYTPTAAPPYRIQFGTPAMADPPKEKSVAPNPPNPPTSGF